jgi:hypothetical protein
MPSKQDLQLEYKVEYEKKGLSSLTNDVFPTFEAFHAAVIDGEIKKVNKSFDRKISNRSRTSTKAGLLSLIKSYKSYPKYRNEDTLDDIYAGFADGSAMKMPLVLDLGGNYRVMSGNTRMDIATHMDIVPQVIIIKVP